MVDFFQRRPYQSLLHGQINGSDVVFVLRTSLYYLHLRRQHIFSDHRDITEAYALDNEVPLFRMLMLKTLEQRQSTRYPVTTARHRGVVLLIEWRQEPLP